MPYAKNTPAKAALLIALFAALHALVPTLALAQVTEFNTPLQTLSDLLMGPIATTVIIIGLALGGYFVMFTDNTRAAQWCVGVIIGGVLVKNADTVASWLSLA